MSTQQCDSEAWEASSQKWPVAMNSPPVIEQLQTLLSSTLSPELFGMAWEYDVIGSFIFHLFGFFS